LAFKFDKDKITKLSSETFNALAKLGELSLLSRENCGDNSKQDI